MGLDVYFRRDIANVLRATAYASEGSAALALELLGEDGALIGEGALVGDPDPEKLLQVYRQGVRHGLVSVGLAFGLELVRPQVQRGQQQEQHFSLVGLLWAEVRRGN